MYPSDFGPGSTLIPTSGSETVADWDLTTLESKDFLVIIKLCLAGSFCSVAKTSLCLNPHLSHCMVDSTTSPK